MDAALIFDIDSSRARTAATDLAKVNAAASKLAGTWSKSENAIRRANGQFASTAEVVNRYGREVRELAAEFNPALNAVYKLQEAEGRLNRSIALGIVTKEQAAMQLEHLSRQYQETANRAAATVVGTNGVQKGFTAVGKTAEVSTHHAANLSFQLNDIGMMMASGQNPFTLMIQQGPQVAQVFSQMSAQGQRIGPTLAGAFRMILNPTTLLTLALIGGSAALVAWGRSAFGAGEEAKTTEERLDALRSAYESVAAASELSGLALQGRIEQYGQYWMSIRAVNDALRETAILEASREASAAVGALGIDSAALQGMENQVRAFMEARDDMSEQSRQIALEALGFNEEARQQYGLQYDELRRISEIQDKLAQDDLGLNERNRLSAEFNDLMRKGVTAGAELKDEMSAAGTETLKVAQEMTKAQAATEKADRAMKGFSATAKATSLGHLVTQAGELANRLSSAASAVDRIGGGIGSGLIEAAGNAWNMALDRVEQIESSSLGQRPTSRPFSVSENAIYGPEAKGGSGGKGGGGGKSPAEQLAEEMKRRWEVLDEGFSSEYMLAMQSYSKDQETLKWALDTKLITQQEYVSNLDMLYTNAWGAQWEKDQLQYQMDQDALQTALDNDLITRDDYYRKRKEMHWANLLSDDNQSDFATDLANTSSYFGQLASLTGNSYDTLGRLQKSFAASAALVNAYLAASQTLADPTLGFWGKMAAYGKVLAAGIGLVGAIKGSGGGSGGGGSASSSANPAVNTQAALQDRYVTVNFDGPAWMRDGMNGLLEEIYQQSKDGRRIIVQEAGR